MSNIIVCPNCSHEFPLEAAMGAVLQNELAQMSLQMKKDLEQNNAVQMQQKEEALKKELEFKKERELAEALDALKKRDEEQQRHILELEEQRRKSAEEQKDLITSLQKQLEETKFETEQARKQAETDILQKQREIEQREADLKRQSEQQQLENERKLREERAGLEQQIREQMETERKLRESESSILIASLTKQIEDLKTQARSQQLQGEAQETALEEVLRVAFPGDVIEPVPKGFKGADCMQRVRVNGEQIGTIIWESKRTKQWASDWIGKLKDDQRSSAAEIAILVTQAMPAEMSKNKIGNHEGVWLTDFASAIGVAMALRSGLIEVARMKTMATGADDKTATLFEYVTSPEFRQAIQAIAETFLTFEADLASEKRAMEKQWKKREATIKRALLATTRLHGSLQGILGENAIPDIQQPQLTA